MAKRIKTAPRTVGGIEDRKKRRDIRERLRAALKQVATKRRGTRSETLILDIIGRLEPTTPLNYDSLPIKPDGFRIKMSDREKHTGKLRELCLLRVVSMAVMYYWLFVNTQDAQDNISCDQYIKWLLSFSPRYQVYGDVRNGWYLANPDHSKKKDGKVVGPPSVPKWIKEGTTV